MIRLSTSQMFYTGRDNMIASQGRLNHTYNQLGTGKRLTSPSDDPVAAAQILNTRTRIDVVTQYNRNIDFADKNLRQTESVLDQIEASLIRLKELAIQLGSDQWSDGQVQSSGLEAKEILNHLQGLVNAQSESGEYIFAGSQADQRAYNGNDFQGDKVERSVQVADDTFIKMLTTGARAFEGLEGLTSVDADGNEFNGLLRPGEDATDPAAESYANNMLGTIQYFVDSLGLGEDETINKEGIRASIDNLDIAFEQVSRTRSQIGSRQNTLDAIKDTNLDFEIFAKQSIAELEDLDYAEAVTRLQIQMNSLQASQQVFGRVSGLSLFNYI